MSCDSCISGHKVLSDRLCNLWESCHVIVVSLNIKCFQIFYTKFSFPECYVAVYNYSSSEPGDLTFDQNEVIMVTEMDGAWWTGSIGERTGMFPAGYVMKMDIPQVSTHVCNACMHGSYIFHSV